MLKIFVCVPLMGIGPIILVSSEVFVAQQMLEFAHSYYFHIPWKVDITVPVTRKLRLIREWWVWGSRKT